MCVCVCVCVCLCVYVCVCVCVWGGVWDTKYFFRINIDRTVGGGGGGMGYKILLSYKY